MSHKTDTPQDYDLKLEDEHDEKKDKKSKQKKEIKKDRDLTIYPIKIDDERKNEGADKYPLNPAVHFLIAIGRVKSGKSLLINNLYLSERFYKDDFQTKILISSTAYNDQINKYMIDEFDYVFEEYSEELLNQLVELVQADAGNGRWLILLDDIIGDVKFSRGRVDAISALASKFRHIGNGEVEGKLSVCITTQYFKYISTILRNNATGYYLMGAFPETEMKKISEALSFFGNGDKNFMEIFKRSRKEEYDFLFCSVEHLEARRNHEDLIWSKKEGFAQPFGNEQDEDNLMEDNIVIDKDNGEQAKQ